MKSSSLGDKYDHWLPSKYGQMDLTKTETPTLGSKKPDMPIASLEERFSKLEEAIRGRVEVRQTVYLNELRARVKFGLLNGTADDILRSYENRVDNIQVIDFSDM